MSKAKTIKKKPRSKAWERYIPVKEKKSQIKSRKEHWNSTWDSNKRDEFIELIKKDVHQKDACAFVGLPVSTLHDWLKKDEKLLEQYSRAEKWMDITTSNVLSSGFNDKDLEIEVKMKYALEWKKRRDKRYTEKNETDMKIKDIDKININIWK